MHFPKNEKYFLKVTSEEIAVWKRATAKVQERLDEKEVEMKLNNRRESEGSWCSCQVCAAAQPCFGVEQEGASA